MSVIAIFSGAFCHETDVARGIVEATGCRLLVDDDLAARAERLSGMPAGKLKKVFTSRPSVFNQFTHEREKAIAYLRLALAEELETDNLLVVGFASMLVARPIGHVLRVCLIDDMAARLGRAVAGGWSEKEAQKQVHRQDEERRAWVELLTGEADPWSTALYDIVIPIGKTTIDEAVALLLRHAAGPVVRPTDASRQAARDFHLAASVEAALAAEGHTVEVQAAGGDITLVINRHVLMLSRLEEELRAIVNRVPGVVTVSTKVGKNYHQSDIYRKYDFQVPSKVLLVDDEREFVQTLSERLQMRDMGSAVAFDGESALTMVREEEPEVMILDLKMPGIDGIEVLRRVKHDRPEIEVIILTGHGSEADRDICMQLGAFAYLQKPVDIDVLSETLKQANAKIQQRRSGGRKPGV
jgi:CheY-like chemotaxis protein